MFREFEAEPISAKAIERVAGMLAAGDLYRYSPRANALSEVAQLELDFADLLGRKYALAVNSGGSAILLALLAAGVRAGDAVLLPAFTFTAVASAVCCIGARPVLVDVGENYCLDPDDLERKAKSAKFLLLSYMRGHAAAIEQIVGICEAHDIALIEDCAHSIGTFWDDRQTGTFGSVSCFSFQDKMINAGEGGIVASDDPELIDRAIVMSGCYETLWKTHASRPAHPNPFQAQVPQYSMRLANLPAVLAREQMADIPARIARFAEIYDAFAAIVAARNESPILPSFDARVRCVRDTVQFRVPEAVDPAISDRLVAAIRKQGVPVHAFGGGTGNERCYWNWSFVPNHADIELRARAIVASSFDLRLRPKMDVAFVERIAAIVCDAVAGVRA
jgi:dTDP-4-amino-4,6-dideoxygalactose transaminase